jgi:hypothetical protein
MALGDAPGELLDRQVTLCIVERTPDRPPGAGHPVALEAELVTELLGAVHASSVELHAGEVT